MKFPRQNRNRVERKFAATFCTRHRSGNICAKGFRFSMDLDLWTDLGFRALVRFRKAGLHALF